MGSQDTLHELIPVERGTEVPDDELTLSGLARRELMRGDAIEGKAWTDAHGAWKSLVTQQVTVLEAMGFRFERTAVPRTPETRGRDRVVYRCTNPSHVPSGAQIDRAIDMKQKTRKPAKTAPTASNALAEVEVAPQPSTTGRGSESVHGGTPALPALPGLGQPVSIYAQVLNTDGTITLGLRNGSRSWLTTITGVVEDVDA